MIGETGEASNEPRELLRQMVFYIFAPIFFASMGCGPTSSITLICR